MLAVSGHLGGAIPLGDVRSTQILLHICSFWERILAFLAMDTGSNQMCQRSQSCSDQSMKLGLLNLTKNQWDLGYRGLCV